MSTFHVRPADIADNDALCRLSEVPIAGRISLALERHPDFFAGAQVQNEAPEVNLCCDNDVIAAVFSTGRRNLFVDGAAAPVRYLSDVRILPSYRGRRPLRIINDEIIARELADPSAMVHSVMFSDNDAMRGVIRIRPPRVLRRMKYIWFYEAGTYRTSAVSLAGRARRYEFGHRIRRATIEDVPAMQDFFDEVAPAKQLYPAYRFDRLGDPYYRDLSIGDYFLAFDGDRLAGITGIWDQESFKRTRIAAYDGALRWLRLPANALSRLATGFALPRPGSCLRYFYLHTILPRDNSVAVFRDLVEHVHARFRGGPYQYFLCGLFTHDPLVTVLDTFRARRDMFAQHYQAGADELPRVLLPDEPMYVESARL